MFGTVLGLRIQSQHGYLVVVFPGKMPTSPLSIYIIENSPTSLVYNSAFNGPNDFKFGTETGISNGPTGHIKIREKLIIISVIIFLMTSCENHE